MNTIAKKSIKAQYLGKKDGNSLELCSIYTFFGEFCHDYATRNFIRSLIVIARC